MRSILIAGAFLLALSLSVVAPVPDVAEAGPQVEEEGLSARIKK
jgi:hypothetical protein